MGEGEWVEKSRVGGGEEEEGIGWREMYRGIRLLGANVHPRFIRELVEEGTAYKNSQNPIDQECAMLALSLVFS